ncbi:hypothetical protein HYPBUDRAFT_232335 [Hyphopichia burtonii NRRL Y-1933]|uniref:Uncharacterized protein n=1 Tax=Hyphopichia burtonii NRRL Y-1933 TaxID=984485 RepID=A0A1E4RDF7_9ASCO|nr:hypothetical protein HYPBUDRAFT_232335 [Hyphopichia burtonii NRRL Y-1933]ODV65282.1 hypothetical protein HYPBUDRAFT_232335 [Hyphopichia burtonii NRRL Y-1933]
MVDRGSIPRRGAFSYHSLRKWFSGKIQRCHRWAPGSIPGLRICFLHIFNAINTLRIVSLPCSLGLNPQNDCKSLTKMNYHQGEKIRETHLTLGVRMSSPRIQKVHFAAFQ